MNNNEIKNQICLALGSEALNYKKLTLNSKIFFKNKSQNSFHVNGKLLDILVETFKKLVKRVLSEERQAELKHIEIIATEMDLDGKSLSDFLSVIRRRRGEKI